MSIRRQVVMDEAEIGEYRRLAKRDGLTLSEWVRQKLRRAERKEASGSVDRKLAAIRAAARHDFPTADIDWMLREIESGYRG
ncbi:MAG: antitoxin [Acidobacteria bacterium]|nr:antitoxin [Acidobacteriota bacterium]MYH31443.1 antitoxin [Acidobacteriota bacterium]MYK88727.1 antitoxin [Acidobacteriota bacterium]